MARTITDETAEERAEAPALLTPIEPSEGERPAARIVDFSITTDSVVATATVITDEATRRVEIDWGDGEEDVVNHRPGTLVRDPSGMIDDPLPEGTYELYHAYDAPEDGLPFERTVLLRVDDVDGGVDFEIQQVRLTPRYRVTHYPMTVRLAGPCDFGGQTSEIDIEQVVGGNLVNEWHWEPSNNFFGESQRFRLEGSGVRREFEVPRNVGDVSSESVYFEFAETDPGLALNPDDKGTFSARLHLDPEGYTGYYSEGVEGRAHLSDAWGHSCDVICSYDKEMELMVPLPTSDPVVFADDVIA